MKTEERVRQLKGYRNVDSISKERLDQDLHTKDLSGIVSLIKKMFLLDY